MRGIYYNAEQSRGCTAVRSYLTDKEEHGLLANLFVGSNNSVIFWQYDAYLRTEIEVIGPEVGRIAKEHGLAPIHAICGIKDPTSTVKTTPDAWAPVQVLLCTPSVVVKFRKEPIRLACYPYEPFREVRDAGIL